ncbi:MAG: 1,4-dihydroxy-2-naphthoate polyprenyltransferase [Myxococcota bacterium]
MSAGAASAALAIQPGSARAWILAARPPTLTAALAPVAVGWACAAAVAGFSLGPAVAALLGAIFIQIGTNFANDVFDYEQGADTEERLGPVRAAQAGLLSPAQMRRGMVVTFGLATLCGVYLTWVAGWPVVAIGVASVLSGIAYTGGPFPLGYNGLGDVFVMIFFGFVAVCGTAYVQVGAVPAIAWWASVPVGALATAVLVVNNIRDRDTDVQCGKRTLVVRLGRVAGLVEYAALLVASYAVPVLLLITGQAGLAVLLPVVTVPLAVALWLGLIRSSRLGDGPAQNRCLARTAVLLLVFAILFAVGLVL